MATSGTVVFRPDIGEIVIEAMERCLIDPSKVSRKQVLTARRSLNLLFVEWAVKGINYWTTAQTTLALVAGTATYTLPTGTVDVLDAVIRRSSADTGLTRISLTDYNALPDKDTQGKPSQFFFDRQYTPQIYLYPVPENATDTIVYWEFLQMEDVTASQQDADVPYRWTEAMCAGLASKMSIKIKGMPNDRIMLLGAQAESAFEDAATEEGEKASLKIIPVE
jgi:hypothetical protein